MDDPPASVVWHVGPDGDIPANVLAAASRGWPIVAVVSAGAPIDARAAELLEECSEVRRSGRA